MKFLRSFLLLCCLLASCVGQTVNPTASSEPLPTTTVFNFPTAEITYIPPSPSPSSTQTPTKWPTITPVPSPTTYIETYPLKQVWIEYGLGGSCCSYFDSFDPIFDVPITTLVIYSDNEILISHPGNPILEKKLSNTEVCIILNRLESLGLNKINSSGINADDPIYIGKGRENWPTDAPFYYLTVNGEIAKHLGIYEPVKEFVIQPVKDMMRFLEQYQPSGMEPYRPDRLAVYVIGGRDFFQNPDKLVPVAWPTDVISLREAINNGLYLEGKDAARIYELFDGEYGKLFVNQGTEYSVFIRPFLPHESRGELSQEVTPFIPPFSCK